MNTREFLAAAAREQKAINIKVAQEYYERKTALLLLALRDGREVRRSELARAIGADERQFYTILKHARRTHTIYAIQAGYRGECRYQLSDTSFTERPEIAPQADTWRNKYR